MYLIIIRRLIGSQWIKLLVTRKRDRLGGCDGTVFMPPPQVCFPVSGIKVGIEKYSEKSLGA